MRYQCYPGPIHSRQGPLLRGPNLGLVHLGPKCTPFAAKRTTVLTIAPTSWAHSGSWSVLIRRSLEDKDCGEGILQGPLCCQLCTIAANSRASYDVMPQVSLGLTDRSLEGRARPEGFGSPLAGPVWPIQSSCMSASCVKELAASGPKHSWHSCSNSCGD